MEEERKWEDMASDCLVCIFCHLGLKELTLALPFVCKSWHKASLDSRCWKKLDFQELGPFYLSGSGFERRFRQKYGVTSSNFSFSSFVKLCIGRSGGSAVELAIPNFWRDSILQILLSASIGCPRLKVLAFPGLFRQEEKQLPELISKWKELEILKISGKPISILEILEQISINCPNFIGLHLSRYINTVDATAIVRCIPRLKILRISGSIICKHDLMKIIEGCKELEVLNVSDCAGFDVDEEILMKTSTMKKFECEKTTKKFTKMHYMILERLRVDARYSRLRQL